MSIEDRFRTALRAEASDAAQATEAKWDEVRSRSSKIRTRRNRGRVAVVGLSTAAVIIAAVALFFSRPGEDRRKITDQPSGAGPAYVVTVEGGAVLVRSSSNGELLRVLAENEDSRNAVNVAVSPNGSQVYFTREIEGGVCGDDFVARETVRVPIGGGPLDVVVANGSNPSLSPTGSYLAYTTSGSPNGCIGGEQHLMRRTIGVDDTDTTISAASSDGSVLSAKSWSKDESILLAEGKSGLYRELFTIEGLPDDPRTTRVRFPDQQPGALEGPAVLLGPRLVAAPLEIDGRWFVVSFDPKTGDVQERLFEVARRPGYLEVDASGQRFLVGVEAETGYTLYRWDADRGLKSLGDRKLRDMAWARGPTEAPKYFVAVTKEGDIEVRETKTGDVVRTLDGAVDTRYGAPTLSAGPDGRYVYVDDINPDPCSGSENPSRRIDRIDLTAGPEGERGEIATGAFPAVSPDGSKLAYVTHTRTCGYHDALVVRDLSGGREQRWTTGDERTVQAPRWSPDSRMLAATMNIGDTTTVVQVDTVESESRSLTDAEVITVPDSTSAYGFITTDELLGLMTQEDATQVVAFDHDGDVRRHIGTLSGVADGIDASATPDGDHVLVSRIPSGDSVSGTDVSQLDWSLSVVSVGGLEPRNLANDVVAATWLHRLPATDGPATTASPAADRAPDTIVAASADGPIVEIDSATGDVIRTIADRPAQPGGRREEIALSPDGKYVYYERAVADPARGCEANAYETGEIMRVPRAGGEPQPYVTGRWPSISPDGKTLVFVSYARCDEHPGRLALIAADRGEDAAILEAESDSARPVSVDGPLSMSPDGNRVLFEGHGGVSRAWTFDRAAQRFSAVEPNTVLARYARNGGVIGLTYDESSETYAVGSLGAADERYFELRGVVVTNLVIDVTGRHILVFQAGPVSNRLLRWSAGDAEPRVIEGNYTAVAW